MVFMWLYAWLTSPESEMLVRSVPASAVSSANPRKAVLHKAGRLLLEVQGRKSTCQRKKEKRLKKHASNGWETEILWLNVVKKRSEC